jgi:hypothetical protein
MVSRYSDNFSHSRMPLIRLTDILSAVSRVCKVTCSMPQLKRLSLSITYRVSNGYRQIDLNPGWKRDVMNQLQALTNDSIWHMRVRFNIRCRLFSQRSMGEREGIEWGLFIPPVIFAVCNNSDKDTYELEGLHVKFLGIFGRLSSRDSNSETILTGKKMLDG